MKQPTPNIQRTGTGRLAQFVFIVQRRLASTADADRSAVGAATTTMNTRRLITVMFAMLLLPAVALAQTAPSSVESSNWGNLFWGIFPIIILVLIFIPLIRRMQKPIVERTQQHMERQVQHMERVEQSLERINKALERRE